MIKSILLKNFQGHRDSELEFSPGLNVISGQSDAGKSSIVRGFWWVFKNRPARAGENWRHWDTEKKDEVSASVKFPEGEVTRFRQGGNNGYRVDGEELVAVRSDVPDEASTVMDLEDHNVQPQHHPYFLISDSPGDVARKLNEVCGIDIIDECLKNGNLLISRTKTEINSTQIRVENLENDVERYKDLERMDSDVSELETVASGCLDLASKIKGVEVLIANVESVESEMGDLKGFLEIEGEADPLIRLHDKIVDEEDKFQQLTTKSEKLGSIQRDIDSQKTDLKRMEKELHELLTEAGICPTCGQVYDA